MNSKTTENWRDFNSDQPEDGAWVRTDRDGTEIARKVGTEIVVYGVRPLCRYRDVRWMPADPPSPDAWLRARLRGWKEVEVQGFTYYDHPTLDISVRYHYDEDPKWEVIHLGARKFFDYRDWDGPIEYAQDLVKHYDETEALRARVNELLHATEVDPKDLVFLKAQACYWRKQHERSSTAVQKLEFDLQSALHDLGVEQRTRADLEDELSRAVKDTRCDLLYELRSIAEAEMKKAEEIFLDGDRSVENIARAQDFHYSALAIARAADELEAGAA